MADTNVSQGAHAPEITAQIKAAEARLDAARTDLHSVMERHPDVMAAKEREIAAFLEWWALVEARKRATVAEVQQ